MPSTPSQSDPLLIQLSHDRWATAQTIDACRALSDDQLHQRFDIGLGSLHDTLLHITIATRIWTDLLNGQPLGPYPEDEQRHSADGLSSMHETASDALRDAVVGQPLDEVFSREAGGRTYVMTRGAILTHVTTHAVHHRAQCVNILRRLGVGELPKTSVSGWSFTDQPS